MLHAARMQIGQAATMSSVNRPQSELIRPKANAKHKPPVICYPLVHKPWLHCDQCNHLICAQKKFKVMESQTSRIP